MVSEYLKPGNEFSEVVKGENIPIKPKSYVDVTKSAISETENPDIKINSEYSASGVSSIPFEFLGIGQPTRKPLWSKRTSTGYFSRRSTDTPTTTRTQKTFRTQYVISQPTEPIEPYTVSAVTNEPLTLELVQPNKKTFNVITPQNKPDHILNTSNVPRSVWTVATTELPESTTYIELDTSESSTQADVVSNEKVKVKSSYTVNQLYGYTCRNVNEYYSVANQCNGYVECENNVAHWHVCPEGLHFDSKRKWPAFPCAYPFEVQCQSQTITSISYVDDLPKGSEIINEPEAKSVEVETVKPEQTIYDYSDYSTPAPEQPTRKPLWSRQTIEISSDIPTTVTQKSYEPPFPSYMRTTYAIFNPQETMESYTNNVIYEPATSESATSASYENLLDDISTTYMEMETETPEPSTLPNESKDDVSNETPAVVSVTYIPPQTIPDISIPNMISPSFTSRPEITVTNQEPTSEPNLNELPAQTTTQNNQPINSRPTWSFPSRPSYAALAPTSTTTTTIKPITHSIIDFTTRPTVSQKPLYYYSVNLLNDYTCRDVNGYYSVENQCDEYIACENNKAYRNLCPDGLYFNPKAKWPAYPCAYPSEVKCPSQSFIHQAQPTDQCYHRYGIFPTSNGDCGHFIMCQEGLATLMSCPSGLAFNPITSTCDWPVNVPDCNLDVFQDFTCPSNDYALISHFISYYKYENSCKQYIICQEGRPRLLSCDAVAPHNVPQRGLVLTKVPIQGSAINDNIRRVSNENATKTSSNNNNVSNTIVPENNLTSSVSYLKFTESPQVVDVTLRKKAEFVTKKYDITIVYPENYVKSSSSVILELPDITTLTPMDFHLNKSVESTERREALSATNNPTTDKNSAPFDLSASSLYEQPQNESFRIIHQSESLTSQTDKIKVGVSNKTLPEDSIPTYPDNNLKPIQKQYSDECPRSYGFFPAPKDDCGHFIMCQEGSAITMSCPPGLAFNSIRSTCDWPVNVPGCNPTIFQDIICPEVPLDTIEDSSHLIYNYRYKNSCKKYIACQEGSPRLLSCDAGLSFDENTHKCVNSSLITNCI
ncbi:uncharacterized protein LOC125069471 [Vanessa atalanta]|uniref:uncharacterized protein LOC125069471 n=1 Tax=Vanessa atalanta TaxID=42275 RepID=UPI001FCCD10D|nr:uncharacterized protein LOC125069471 [Vanessa atalanta]